MDDSVKKTFEAFSSRSDWFRKSYQAREFPWHVQIWSIQKMMKKFPWSQRYGGTISEAGGMQHWLWNSSEMVRARGEFLQRVLADSTFLDDFERGFSTQWKTFVRAEQGYIADYSIMDLTARVETFYELCDVESQVGMYGYMNDVFLTAGGSDWLLEWFDRELPSDVPDREQVIVDLAVPVHPSFVQEQQMALIAIALQTELKWPMLLQKHQRAWAWVENSYIESEPIGVEEFLERVRVLREHGEATSERLAALQSAAQRKIERKQELYRIHAISQRLQTVIGCSDRISHMTDIRKQGVLRLNALVWQFFRDVSLATDVPFDTLIWMIPAELREMIANRQWDVLEERKRLGSMTLVHEGLLSLIQGEEFTQLDLSPFLGNADGKTSLNGQVAFKGVVAGTARVIRGRNDFAHFLDGDILITNQTTPEFIPLMKRAAAVVTEQGGITCHAAIVSREMQIPCIIGATSAMTFFHDNQKIIVDGEKGEVRYA